MCVADVVKYTTPFGMIMDAVGGGDLSPGPRQPAMNAPPPKPNDEPPAPEKTATGLLMGERRQAAPPIKKYLKKALGAQQDNSLVIPLNTDANGVGVNIPR